MPQTSLATSAAEDQYFPKSLLENVPASSQYLPQSSLTNISAAADRYFPLTKQTSLPTSLSNGPAHRPEARRVPIEKVREYQQKVLNRSGLATSWSSDRSHPSHRDVPVSSQARETGRAWETRLEAGPEVRGSEYRHLQMMSSGDQGFRSWHHDVTEGNHLTNQGTDSGADRRLKNQGTDSGVDHLKNQGTDSGMDRRLKNQGTDSGVDRRLKNQGTDSGMDRLKNQVTYSGITTVNHVVDGGADCGRRVDVGAEERVRRIKEFQRRLNEQYEEKSALIQSGRLHIQIQTDDLLKESKELLRRYPMAAFGMEEHRHLLGHPVAVDGTEEASSDEFLSLPSSLSPDRFTRAASGVMGDVGKSRVSERMDTNTSSHCDGGGQPRSSLSQRLDQMDITSHNSDDMYRPRSFDITDLPTRETESSQSGFPRPAAESRGLSSNPALTAYSTAGFPDLNRPLAGSAVGGTAAVGSGQPAGVGTLPLRATTDVSLPACNGYPYSSQTMGYKSLAGSSAFPESSAPTSTKSTTDVSVAACNGYPYSSQTMGYKSLAGSSAFPESSAPTSTKSTTDVSVAACNGYPYSSQTMGYKSLAGSSAFPESSAPTSTKSTTAFDTFPYGLSLANLNTLGVTSASISHQLLTHANLLSEAAASNKYPLASASIGVTATGVSLPHAASATCVSTAAQVTTRPADVTATTMRNKLDSIKKSLCFDDAEESLSYTPGRNVTLGTNDSMMGDVELTSSSERGSPRLASVSASPVEIEFTDLHVSRVTSERSNSPGERRWADDQWSWNPQNPQHGISTQHGIATQHGITWADLLTSAPAVSRPQEQSEQREQQQHPTGESLVHACFWFWGAFSILFVFI